MNIELNSLLLLGANKNIIQINKNSRLDLPLKLPKYFCSVRLHAPNLQMVYECLIQILEKYSLLLAAN